MPKRRDCRPPPVRFTVHSEVQLEPDTSNAWRPHCRRWPTTIGARTASRAAATTKKNQAVVWSKDRKLQQRSKRRIRKYLGRCCWRRRQVSRHRGHLKLPTKDRRRGTRTARGRRGGLRLGRVPDHQFLLGLPAREGERPIARSWRCVKGWRRVTPVKQPQIARPHDVAGDAGRSWSAVVPADQHVACQRAHASHVSTCCRSLRASLITEDKNRTSRRFDLAGQS